MDSVGAGVSKFAAELGRIDLEVTSAHTLEDEAEGLDIVLGYEQFPAIGRRRRARHR